MTSASNTSVSTIWSSTSDVVTSDFMTDNWTLVTDNVTVDPMVASRPDPGWALLVLLVIPATAVVANCVVCVAVRRHLPLQNSSFYILSSLAVADILRGIFIGAPLLTRTVTGGFPLGADLCDVWLALDAILMGVVLFHHFMLTLDWYQAIKEPLQYKLYDNTIQIWIKIVMAWLLGLIAGVVYIILLKISPPTVKEQIQECGPVSMQHAFVKVITTFCLPCVATVYVFLLAMKAAKSTANEAKQVHKYAHRLRSGTSFDDVCHSEADSENGFIIGNGITLDDASDYAGRPRGKELLNEPLVEGDMLNGNGDIGGLDNPGYESDKDKDDVESLSDSIRRGHGSLKRQKAVVEDCKPSPDLDENSQKEVVLDTEGQSSSSHIDCECETKQKPENQEESTSDVQKDAGTEDDKMNKVLDENDHNQVIENSSSNNSENVEEILTNEEPVTKPSVKNGLQEIESNKQNEDQENSNNENGAHDNKYDCTVADNTVTHVQGDDVVVHATDNQSKDDDPEVLENDHNVLDTNNDTPNDEEASDNSSDITASDFKDSENENSTNTQHVSNELNVSSSVNDKSIENNTDTRDIINDLNDLSKGNESEAEKQDSEQMEKVKQSNDEHSQNSASPSSLDVDINHQVSDNESESASSTASHHHGKKRKKSVRFKSSDGKIVEPAATNGSVLGFTEKICNKRLSDIGETAENSDFNHIKLDFRVTQSLPSDPREYVAQINHAQSLRMSLRLKRHMKMLRVLAVMFVAFIILYLPYMVLISVLSFCVSCRDGVDDGVHAALSWIAFSTSMINPFIYILLVPQFRKAFAYSCESVQEDF